MKHGIIILLIVTAIVMTSCNGPTEEDDDPGIYNNYKLCLYDIESGESQVVHDFGRLEFDYRPEFALFSKDGSKIVYYRKYQLHSINLDGSDHIVISGELRADRDFPFTSDDGVYFSAYNGDLRDIYITPWSTLEPENITDTDSADEHNPYLNETFTKMLYAADKDTTSSLVELDLTTGNETVQFSSDESKVNYPAFSPIQLQLFFFHGSHITFLDVKNQTPITLSDYSHYDWTGQLSFNSSYHCFACSAGHFNVVNYQTLELIELELPHYSTIYPCLSSSNTYISYTSGSVVVFDIDEMAEILVVDNGYYSRISPDDSSIIVLIQL